MTFLPCRVVTHEFQTIIEDAETAHIAAMVEPYASEFVAAINALHPRPASEYHEDMGPVLWWKFPLDEPPYVGTPNDCGFTVQVNIDVNLRTFADPAGEEKEFVASRNVGGWPGYHTHFTPLPIPQEPRR